jgi:hypothetical protein
VPDGIVPLLARASAGDSSSAFPDPAASAPGAGPGSQPCECLASRGGKWGQPGLRPGIGGHCTASSLGDILFPPRHPGETGTMASPGHHGEMRSQAKATGEGGVSG